MKNCSLSDPVHGSSKVVFGQTKYLEPEPGYQWTNSLGQSINSVKCDFYDFGGVYESIKLDYKWKCIDGYYKLGDSSCKGKSSLKEKHNIALTINILVFYFKACDCNREGSILSACDGNGVCQKCRNNVIGEKCDKSDKDMFGFPNCRYCKCKFSL